MYIGGFLTGVARDIAIQRVVKTHLRPEPRNHLSFGDDLRLVPVHHPPRPVPLRPLLRPDALLHLL